MMPYKTSVETPVGLDVQTLAEGFDRKIEVIVKEETSFHSIKRKWLNHSSSDYYRLFSSATSQMTSGNNGEFCVLLLIQFVNETRKC